MSPPHTFMRSTSDLGCVRREQAAAKNLGRTVVELTHSDVKRFPDGTQLVFEEG